MYLTKEFLIYLVLTISKRQTALDENDWRVVRIPIRETRPDMDGINDRIEICDCQYYFASGTVVYGTETLLEECDKVQCVHCGISAASVCTV